MMLPPLELPFSFDGAVEEAGFLSASNGEREALLNRFTGAFLTFPAVVASSPGGPTGLVRWQFSNALDRRAPIQSTSSLLLPPHPNRTGSL
jgi:hypothetical protein